MASASDRPTVFALHGLGLGSRLFAPLTGLLADSAEVIALDLPGFGGNAGSGYSVDEMARSVLRAIRRTGATRWMLLGHSMGAKIATVVASRVLAGEAPVFGLAGVVLLAGSPAVPEPMAAEQRETMLGWARSGAMSADAAREFVDGNVGGPLPADLDRIAIDDVERSAPDAWIAWLERGSREDWSARVGVLDVPALLLAGGSDGPLGPPAQRDLTASAYRRSAVEVLDGAGHLLPLERPDAVADAIRRFWDRVGGGPVVPADFARTLASDRTSARVRASLARRALADDPDYAPQALTRALLDTLRAIAEVAVPQESPAIDIAARVDAQLAEGAGDGWRSPELPPDPEAYRAALDALAAVGDLPLAERTERIRSLLHGEAGAAGGLTPEQLTAWAQDAVTDLARQWLSHPATMAAIGYDGISNGGDGVRQQGFLLIGPGEREAWEPVDAR